jgi:hypothetical protein
MEKERALKETLLEFVVTGSDARKTSRGGRTGVEEGGTGGESRRDRLNMKERKPLTEGLDRMKLKRNAGSSILRALY